jgi:hypothetical protein
LNTVLLESHLSVKKPSRESSSARRTASRS